MLKLKVIQIGNSFGVILPREVLAQLRVDKGDALLVTETVNGVFMTGRDLAVEEEMALGRQFMNAYRDTFHALAT
jgi:putative addiction module antidote